MNKAELLVFSGGKNFILTNSICEHIGIPVAKSDTTVFPDGEILVKVNEDVRGKDCFVVLSTCSPVNENLMELLIFIDCLRRASAGQVIAVIPYFGYARQDRKNEGRVPITAKLVANMLTAAGVDRILTVDLHAAQIQGFFDIPVDHLSGSKIFIDYFRKNPEIIENLCVVSPDVGNVKVAEKMANFLKGDLAIINKKRNGNGEIETRHIIGDVRDKTVLLFDDIISTATTICNAADFVIEHGAISVIAAATHAVMVGQATDKLKNSKIDKVICTNTIDRDNLSSPYWKIGKKYQELSICPLLGDAIIRIHNNESISALLAETAGSKR